MKKKGKRTQKNEEGLQEDLDEKDEILPEPQSQVIYRLLRSVLRLSMWHTFLETFVKMIKVFTDWTNLCRVIFYLQKSKKHQKQEQQPQQQPLKRGQKVCIGK